MFDDRLLAQSAADRFKNNAFRVAIDAEHTIGTAFTTLLASCPRPRAVGVPARRPLPPTGLARARAARRRAAQVEQDHRARRRPRAARHQPLARSLSTGATEAYAAPNARPPRTRFVNGYVASLKLRSSGHRCLRRKPAGSAWGSRPEFKRGGCARPHAAARDRARLALAPAT